ncbi:hypothetical protein B9C75_07435 [Bifidobacterium bifidum]|nr:hypothetical protein B9C75_07435 [Bifidobacterium bifidum]
MTLTSGQSHAKPISAFALISWGAHGHTHASQTRASLGVLSIAVLLVVALVFLLLQKDPTRD